MLTPMQFAMVGAAAFAASTLRAFTGFGFALIAVPVFSLFLSPANAVVLSATLTLSVSSITYKTWWGDFPWQYLPPVLAGSLLGTAVGVYFLRGLDAADFKLWIGASVLFAAVMLAVTKPKQRGKPPVTVSGTTGILSGLMNGAFAIPGPPVIVYAMAYISDAKASRAFLIGFFAMSNAVSLVMFEVAGIVTAAPLLMLLAALPLSMLGDRAGTWLFHKVGSGSYRPIALFVTGVLGLVNILSGLAS